MSRFENSNFNQLGNLSVFINVKAYGAKGDGVTDDTTAIQNAINALTNGGTLVFPVTSSFYKITGGLPFNALNNINILSNGATIKFANGTIDTQYNAFPNFGQDSLFRMNDCSNILIDGLTLHGNISNRTAHTGGVVPESLNSNILLMACSNVTIRKCVITEAMTDGVLVSYDSNYNVCANILIENCLITKSRRNNISMVCHDGVIVRDCILDSPSLIQGVNPKSNIGIEPDHVVGQSKNVLIEGCKLSNAPTYGAYAGGLGTENLKFIGNSFVGNGYHGINLEEYSGNTNSMNTVVVGNIFENNAQYGVRVNGTIDCDLIADNIFRNNQYGIACYLVDGLIIKGNKFISNTYGGVYADYPGSGFKHIEVVSNLFIDNNSTAGESNTQGYSFIGEAFDTNAICLFNDNIMYSSPSATTKMHGAKITNTIGNCRANGNVAKNLADNANWLINIVGNGNFSIDGSQRYQAVAGEQNFSVSAGGAKLLIEDHYHTGGTAAPTTGTWSVGDVVYNTNPSNGSYMGWTCTVAGTPGTWKPFGFIISQDFGQATIPASGTSVIVSHGLPNVPFVVTATAQGNVGGVWVDTITATQFTIHCGTAPTGATTITWIAQV